MCIRDSNWDEHRDHFILADCPDHDVDFGEGKKSIFALEGTEILIQRDKEVQMAAHEYGQGRGVYISGCLLYTSCILTDRLPAAAELVPCEKR